LVGARRGIEATILPQRRYRYHLLPLEPIHRRDWWRNARWPVLALRLMRACSRVLNEERPVLALGTGGYASGPVLFQVARRGIPFALQEQNAYPGIATRLLARRARDIYLGFPEARDHLRLKKGTSVFVFGNPVVPPAPPGERGAARARLGIPDGVPVLLVMGGSQGARSINMAVRALLESGSMDDVALLWSTGRLTWAEYSGYQRPPSRFVRDFWDPIGEAYSAADLVVARAGAMTTAELCAWGLPAIYVPLPGAAADHQTKNALALAEAGAAIHLPEARLSPESLCETVRGVLGERGRLDSMSAAALARGRPDAAQRTASRLLAMVS
jgi:UDP-N-acetylglucosamine--N-acetylmuramyl-(pentapeptide) pyrophosphoryl-undecaprenol N-acetylglucosamine transferase